MGPNLDAQTPVRANQVKLVVADHSDRIIPAHRMRTVDLSIFGSKNTLLDITLDAFKDQVSAPLKTVEDKTTGEIFSAREVVKILDLEKKYETDQSIKDGFQAYPAIMKDGQILKIGLTIETDGKTMSLLNAEQTTADMLRDLSTKNMPEGAELVIVWRRDIGKTQDVTSAKHSELFIEDDAPFKLPHFEIITCSGGIGKQKIEFGGPTTVGLYAGNDEDKISFNAVVSMPEELAYAPWDAGLFPQLELQKQYPNPQYFDAVGFESSDKPISYDTVLPLTSFFNLLNNQSSNPDTTQQDHTCPFCNAVLTSTSQYQQTVTRAESAENQKPPDSVPQAEESMYMHLLMHPELKWMRRLYGLDFDGDPPPSPMAMRIPSAHSTARADRNRQVFQRPRQQSDNYDDQESSSPANFSFKMQQPSSSKMQASDASTSKDAVPKSSLHFFTFSPDSLQSKDAEQPKTSATDDEKEIEDKKKKVAKKARNLKEAEAKKRKEKLPEKSVSPKPAKKKELKLIQTSNQALPPAKKKAEMPQEEMKKLAKAVKPALPKLALPKIENPKIQAEKTSEKKEKQKTQVASQHEQKIAKEVQNKAKIPVQQLAKPQILSTSKDKLKEKRIEEKKEIKAETIPKREIKTQPKKQAISDSLLSSPFSSPFAQVKNSRMTFTAAA